MYRAIVWRTSDGWGGHAYVATHPEFDYMGIRRSTAQGDTPDEARRNLDEVRGMAIDHLRTHGLPVPEPQPLVNGETWTIELE